MLKLLSALLSSLLLIAACAAAPKPAATSEIDAIAARALAGAPGLVVGVARGGEVLLLKAYGTADLEHAAPMSADAVFAIASVTKMFTAAAALSLAEDGVIDLDAPLARWNGDFPNAENITLYELLTHTSGVPDYAEDAEGERTKSVAKTREEMVAWIARLARKPDFAPGASWRYSNSNYVLIADVLEKASGEPLSEIFEQQLFGPAGLRHTAFDDPADIVRGRARGYRKAKDAPSGFRNAGWISPTMPGPAGGLRSTARDLLKFSGALFGGKIVGEEWLARMTAPALLAGGERAMTALPKEAQDWWNADYGMGVLVGLRAGRRRYSHPGDIDGFRSVLSYFPEEEVTVVVLMNAESGDLYAEEFEGAALRFAAGRQPRVSLSRKNGGRRFAASVPR